MILLRANAELKVIFAKLINTMGKDIKWTEVFIINNNNLVLAGKDSVLFFDFGNKGISNKPTEVNLKEDSIVQITKNEFLENTLNITLYAFGKWGKIKGLTVERDYSQINELFGNLLKEIDVEPVLSADHLRFYKHGVQITYEDIIQDILKKQKEKDDKEKEQSEAYQQEENEAEKGKYDIGLWHKIIWTSSHYELKKEDLSDREKDKSRLGNNFYKISYQCPNCSDNLSMVIYPEGKELLIETDEKGVYLARAYTCSNCHRFYTPKPRMLLAEGSVFSLDFEDDTNAYEDYLEVLGKQGERTYNCNFNEYEADYRKRKSQSETQLEEICKNIEDLSDKEVVNLKDKMESGFYPQKSVEHCHKKVVQELKKRKRHPHKSKNNVDNKEADNGKQIKENGTSDNALEVQKLIKSNTNPAGLQAIRKEEAKKKSFHIIKTSYHGKSKDMLRQETEAQPEQDNQKENLSPLGQENFNRKKIYPQHPANERTTLEKDKISGVISSSKPQDRDLEKVLMGKAEACKDKDYITIARFIEEMKDEDCSNSVKENILLSLKKLLEIRGRKELEVIRSKIPENINKAQYLQFKEKIEQYREIDNHVYKSYLEDKRDGAEKQEIAALIRRVNAKDRSSLMELYQKLKKEDYEYRNITPFLDDIKNKIYSIDEMTIKRICGDPAELTYEDGRKAYEELSSKDLLPELKTNILSLIDKRLTKIKMNECEQLIQKLSKDISKVLSKHSRIHFYDVRKGLRNNPEEEETLVIHKALSTYAAGRGKYEFPILICDASNKSNGSRGFVLTPDHIFYNTIVDSGIIDVMNINNINARKGLISKGIYAFSEQSGSVKIANNLDLRDVKIFANVLNEFVSYLKEKPESRDIAYIAKEKHSVKCCYRCGHVYRGDNICPKCGAKFNE